MIWLLTLLSLFGVVLNIKKRHEAFYCWSCSNFLWAIIDYRAGLLEQAVLFGVYFLLALYGLYEWRIK